VSETERRLRILRSFLTTAVLVGLVIATLGVAPLDWWPVR